jgi:hypothetical protein
MTSGLGKAAAEEWRPKRIPTNSHQLELLPKAITSVNGVRHFDAEKRDSLCPTTSTYVYPAAEKVQQNHGEAKLVPASDRSLWGNCERVAPVRHLP